MLATRTTYLSDDWAEYRIAREQSRLHATFPVAKRKKAACNTYYIINVLTGF